MLSYLPEAKVPDKETSSTRGKWISRGKTRLSSSKMKKAQRRAKGSKRKERTSLMEKKIPEIGIS